MLASEAWLHAGERDSSTNRIAMEAALTRPSDAAAVRTALRCCPRTYKNKTARFCVERMNAKYGDKIWAIPLSVFIMADVALSLIHFDYGCFFETGAGV